MMKDRDQKEKALRLSVANRWLPQLEVDVDPGRGVSKKTLLVTDLDVLSSAPDDFVGFRAVVFDCKTRAKESPVNRALWLSGVLNRVNAQQGFCVLKKSAIAVDHRLMANRLSVILLAEDEFDLYARATKPRYATERANVASIDAWERFFAISSKFPKLQECFRFARSTFWMTDDSAEACRGTLASLRAVHPELDPAKREHVALFLDYCAIFARSLAVVVSQLFRSYLHPSSQADLADALLAMLYGGRAAYQHRNELFKRVMATGPTQPPPDLALPEWNRFLQLTRQLLDAPIEFQRSALVLRELAFSHLSDDRLMVFAKQLCAESPQSARFASLIPSYLARAAKLPQEFSRIADDLLLPLIPIK